LTAPDKHGSPLFTAVFLAAGSGLFAAVAVGAFNPHPLLWGVDHLAYYHPLIRLGALVLVAAAFLPGVGEWLYDRLDNAVKWTARSRPRRFASAAAAALAALSVFIMFQSSTELLGDGQLLATRLTRTVESPDITPVDFTRTVLDDSTAPGAHLLAYLVAKTFGGEDPLTAFRLLTAVLGCLFVFAVFWFTDPRRSFAQTRTLPAVVLVLSGSIELFFGYIETYVPMLVLSALYAATAIDSLRGRRHPVVPIACFVFAAALHYQALLLAPTLLYVLLSRAPTKRPRALAGAIGGLTVIAAVIAARSPGSAVYFLPLVGKGSLPGIFSSRHIADISNQIVLVVPTIPLLSAAALSGMASRGSLSSRARSGDSDNRVEELELVFALLLFVPCAMFLFAFVPELGMARDWDLFVLPALGAAAPVFVLARRALDAADIRRHFVPAAALALAIVIPWVGVNADETKSVRRYERILSAGTIDSGYGYEILAMHHEDRGDFKSKAAAYDKAYTISKNPRHLVSACSARLRSGESDRAIETLRSYLRTNPEYDLAREVYLEGLLGTDQLSEVIRVSNEGITINPERHYYYYALGIAYALTGLPDKARKAFAECRALDPPSVMIDAIDDVLRELDE
jgi:tetratricopeptide (TPR) repeat protein